MAAPRKSTIDAWTALVSTSDRLVAAIEAGLKAADLPPLGWYDAMLEIEKAGDEGIRPFELKARLLLPQYGTSRLLDRIEKAEYIRRETCAEDGRGQVIRLTDAGREMRRRMWPVYAALLNELVEGRLAPDEAHQLAALLWKLRGAAAPQ